MILAVSHRSSYKNIAEEICCPLNQLGTIFDFIKQNPNKRYNISFKQEQELSKLIEQMEYVKAVKANYTIECENTTILKTLLNMNYNAYLKFPVCDWETFQSLLAWNVSDIYIDGALGFQCDRIARVKEEKEKLKIRSTPTFSPNASLREPAANHFFIRPEDTSFYSSAIDILDLRQPLLEKENALFSIYRRGSFNFNISELIQNVPENVNNVALVGFAEKRLNCMQRCLIPGYHCKWCSTQFTFVERATKYGKIKSN